MDLNSQAEFVQQETRKKRQSSAVGTVVAVTEHTDPSDKSNHEVNVMLRDSEKELRRVPVAARVDGSIYVPQTGDFVLVTFLGGMGTAPVVTDVLYSDDPSNRAPLGRAGHWRRRFGASDEIFLEAEPGDHSSGDAEVLRFAKKPDGLSDPGAEVGLDDTGSEVVARLWSGRLFAEADPNKRVVRLAVKGGPDQTPDAKIEIDDSTSPPTVNIDGDSGVNISSSSSVGVTSDGDVNIQPSGDANIQPSGDVRMDNGSNVHADNLRSVGSVSGPVTGGNDLSSMTGNNLSIDQNGNLNGADTRIESQDSGTTLYSNTSVLNFDTSTDLTVTDDGNGNITIGASAGSTTDTRVESRDSGTTLYADTSVLNFDTSSDISVTDDGNGNITISASSSSTDTRVESQDAGTTLYSNTSVLNFDTSSDLTVTDNGNGTITIGASAGSSTDTRVETQDAGTTLYTDTTVMNFDTTTDLSVTDDGNGTITIGASGSGSGGIPDRHYMAANGADTTGSSSCDSTFSDLVSVASPGDTIVFEEGGHYVLNDRHVITKPLTLDWTGATIELTRSQGDSQIRFIPDSSGESACVEATTDLSSDVEEGSTRIPVADTSIFSKGDHVLIFDRGSIALSPTTDNEHHCQFGKVEAILDTDGDGTNDTIQLSVGVHRRLHASSESGQVARISMLDGPAIVGGTVIGGGDYPLEFNFCEHARYEDVTIEDQLTYAFRFEQCWRSEADSCTVRHPQTFGSGEAEYIYVKRSGDIAIRDAVVEKCRRGIDMIAGSYSVYIENPRIYNYSSSGISVHQDNPCGTIHVQGGEIRGADDSGHNLTGNCISGSSDLDQLIVQGCELQSVRSGINIKQPTIVSDCVFKPARDQSSGAAMTIQSSNVQVENCTIDEQSANATYSAQPVRIDSGIQTIENVQLDLEMRLDNPYYGVYLIAAETGNPIRNVRIRGTVDCGSNSAKAVHAIPRDDVIDGLDISMDVMNATSDAILLDHEYNSGFGKVRIHDSTIRCGGHAINTSGSGSNTSEMFHLSNLDCEAGESSQPCVDVDQPVNYLFINNCLLLNPNGSDGITTHSASTTRLSNNYPTL